MLGRTREVALGSCASGPIYGALTNTLGRARGHTFALPTYAQAKKLLRKPDPIKHRLAKYVRRRR
jgi:hypothetical protein